MSTHEKLHETSSRSSRGAMSPADGNDENPLNFIGAAEIEKAEERPPARGGPRPFSHGFFDKEVAPLRAVVFKIIAGVLVILTVVMWTACSAYWGSLWKSNIYTNKLQMAIINHDLSPDVAGGSVPLLGAYFIDAAMANANGSTTGGSTVGTLGYTLGYTGYEGSSEAGSWGTDENVINNKLLQHELWGVIIIAPDATQQIQTARETGNSSFDPTSLVQFYYSQARNEQAASYYVAINSEVMTEALTKWSAMSAAAYLGASASNATAITALASAPQTISPGASWTAQNLRPYNQPVAAAVTLVGGIYSVIFTFILTMGWASARAIISPYLTTKALLTIRLAVPLTLYLYVSLIYAMINLPFRVHFGAHFNYAAGFFVWWMILYLTMAACGLATEFFITILTARFVAFSLLPLILVQVCVTSLPEELQPRIFHYGSAVPLQRLGRAVRTIIFNTKNEIGADVGIIIAWVVCSVITTTVATYLYRRKELKDAEAAKAKATSA